MSRELYIVLELHKFAQKSTAIFLTQLKMQSEKASDVTLVLKDGKEIRVSWNELSAASDFFFTLQNTDMKERREGIIRLEHVNENVMRDVLEFSRSGTVHITYKNAQHALDLFEAADYFLIPGLKRVAVGSLRRILQPSNCISIYYFAERYPCKEVAQLAVTAREYIFANFADVAESQEFLQLESTEVERWICCDEIVVSSEEVVFRIILNWIEQEKSERRGKFLELFRHVRLFFISRANLKKYFITNHFLKVNSCCLKRVEDALKGIFPVSDDRQQSPRNWSDSHLAICNGEETLCYDPVKEKWYQLSDMLSPYPGYSSNRPKPIFLMTSFQGQLFVLFPASGYQKCTPHDIYNYDSSSNRWIPRLTIADMPQVVNKVVVVGKDIFIFHTKHCSKNYNYFISKYDPSSNVWNVVSSGEETAFINHGTCAVSMGDFLYVLGGLNKRQAKRFDTVENKWERIADMNEEKTRGCGAAAHGKIFVTGGAVVSCEMYDVLSNQWQNVALSSNTRRFGVISMICFNGRLYIVKSGVSCRSRPFAAVESFNIKTEKWKKTTKISLPFPVFRNETSQFFKACSIYISRDRLLEPYPHPCLFLREMELCFPSL